MEEEMDFKTLFKYFWNRKIIIFCILLVCFLLLNVYFLVFTKALYSNTVRVRIPYDATENRVNSYNDLLKTNSLIELAIKDSGVNASVSELKENLYLKANNGSKLYTIVLNYKNKTDGKVLCNSIINQFIQAVKAYDGNSVVIYDNVVTSSKPVNYNLFKLEIMYFIISTVLSLGIIFVLYYFDYSIKNNKELKGYNVLGTIFDEKDTNNINKVKTKIKLNNLGPIIFMNTAREVDCKEALFALMKEFSKDAKVLFIDTNIRKNKNKKQGYTDILSKYDNKFSKYINNSNGINIMEAGTVNTNVEVLLSNDNNKKLLDDLKKEYDYIVLYNCDGIDYSDSLILSKLCDANYVLVEINATDRRDFEELIEIYKQVHSEVNGVIVVDNTL